MTNGRKYKWEGNVLVTEPTASSHSDAHAIITNVAGRGFRVALLTPRTFESSALISQFLSEVNNRVPEVIQYSYDHGIDLGEEGYTDYGATNRSIGAIGKHYSLFCTGRYFPLESITDENGGIGLLYHLYMTDRERPHSYLLTGEPYRPQEEIALERAYFNVFGTENANTPLDERVCTLVNLALADLDLLGKEVTDTRIEQLRSRISNVYREVLYPKASMPAELGSSNVRSMDEAMLSCAMLLRAINQSRGTPDEEKYAPALDRFLEELERFSVPEHDPSGPVVL